MEAAKLAAQLLIWGDIDVSMNEVPPGPLWGARRRFTASNAVPGRYSPGPPNVQPGSDPFTHPPKR